MKNKFIGGLIFQDDGSGDCNLFTQSLEQKCKKLGVKFLYNSKVKDFDDFYMNPFKWDATVRIGWGFINLFATYSVNTMFKKDKGPELYPWTVGITFVNL